MTLWELTYFVGAGPGRERDVYGYYATQTEAWATARRAGLPFPQVREVLS